VIADIVLVIFLEISQVRRYTYENMGSIFHNASFI